jgi:hypothetical protein
MPGDVFDDLAAVAKTRGVDVSGVLNWLISEARPRLMQELAEHERAMLKAASSRAWEGMEPVDALRTLRDLLGKLQDEYGELSKRVLGKSQQRAG